MPAFSDSVAIVTGGGSGIGRATAETLAAEGVAVIIADVDTTGAGEVAEAIHSAGKGAAAPIELDVRSAESCERVVQFALDRFGRIDILVNSAGVGPRPGPFTELSEEQYDRVMDINAKGTFLMSRQVTPHLVNRGTGRIVNVASVVGKRSPALALGYGSSKWAVIGMTQTMAMELAPIGITVNAVCPGVVRTALHERVVGSLSESNSQSEDDVWGFFLDQIPMKRLQDSQDMADMIVFLASDKAKNITGQAINVNGGMELH